MSWEDETVEAIRGELRPGGRPTQVYLGRGAEKRLTSGKAAALTTAILLNMEDRLVAVERATGIFSEEHGG